MEPTASMETIRKIGELGADVLASPRMQALRGFIQHGRVTRYEHCLSVCYIALRLAQRMNIRVDERSMVRGALLHDYFLYDWHDPENLRLLHGFTHPGEALRSALEEFELNAIERDVIHRHMFPLTPVPPHCREALLVSIADKVSAVLETFGVRSGMRVSALCRSVR